MSKLYPQCHPYWFNEDGTTSELKNIRILTHTATGYIVPCCETDLPDGLPENLNEELREHGLLDEELKIKNVSSIQNILISPQWVKFHKMLIEEPEKAPRVCHKICGKPNPSYLTGGVIDDE